MHLVMLRYIHFGVVVRDTHDICLGDGASLQVDSTVLTAAAWGIIP